MATNDAYNQQFAEYSTYASLLMINRIFFRNNDQQISSPHSILFSNSYVEVKQRWKAFRKHECSLTLSAYTKITMKSILDEALQGTLQMKHPANSISHLDSTAYNSL